MTAPWGFKSVFMGVEVGFAGRQAWFWPLSHSGPAALLRGRKRFCTSEAIRAVRLLEINIGAVAHRAMWGYGVGPPSDTQSGGTSPFLEHRLNTRTARLMPAASPRR